MGGEGVRPRFGNFQTIFGFLTLYGSLNALTLAGPDSVMRDSYKTYPIPWWNCISHMASFDKFSVYL